MDNVKGVTTKAKETTVFLDGETSRKLGVLAKAYERSKAAQVRFWVNRDYAQLDQSKSLSDLSESSNLPKIDEVA